MNNSLKIESGAKKRPGVLILSTSPLIDRVVLYTDTVRRLSANFDVTIWASSKKNAENDDMWEKSPARVEPFPEILPFREFPYNYLRRMNEFVWDYRFPVPSRISMRRHVRDKKQRLLIKSLKLPAFLLAMCRLESELEDRTEKLLLGYRRSPEAEMRLKELDPNVIISTGPFQFEQPAVFSAARSLGIPTLAYVPSWDNITTKNRMVFDYDGYIVWSDQNEKELLKYYPKSQNKPVYKSGAPQFDIFFKKKFYQSREEFCRGQSLDPDVPIIVYAIGSPNFLCEYPGAVALAERITKGELGNVQLIVRPHPMHDRGELQKKFITFASSVKLQQTADADLSLTERSQDETQIIEWINTFRHADVVVNLSSTVTIDAAIFDKPVINLDFDPQPGRPDQLLIRDINHKWNHFKPIAESGAVWLVENIDQMVTAIRGYLDDPSLHREKRREIVEYVCGQNVGDCGSQLAGAIEDFAGRSLRDRIYQPRESEEPAMAY